MRWVRTEEVLIKNVPAGALSTQCVQSDVRIDSRSASQGTALLVIQDIKDLLAEFTGLRVITTQNTIVRTSVRHVFGPEFGLVVQRNNLLKLEHQDACNPNAANVSKCEEKTPACTCEDGLKSDKLPISLVTLCNGLVEINIIQVQVACIRETTHRQKDACVYCRRKQRSRNGDTDQRGSVVAQYTERYTNTRRQRNCDTHKNGIARRS
mmetsp:Transcript_8150/g.16239  ORF Transcript_8150/g.16239 Transcript_8150/m.16239 type:complete len:209 (-) Transcript_8150:1470-2096(-)